MKKTLATLLVPLAIGCGSPQAYTREHVSNMQMPIGEVASEMKQDILTRNYGDAIGRAGEHTWSLGEVSASQEKMYRSGAAQDANSILDRAKSCYHDTDLSHCAPKLGEYFPSLVDWEKR